MIMMNTAMRDRCCISNGMNAPGQWETQSDKTSKTSKVQRVAEISRSIADNEH